MNFDTVDTISPEMEKRIKRSFDLEEGKTVLVVVKVDKGDIALVSDYRCLDKDTEVCNGCDLRFNCYLSRWLQIKVDELQPDDIEQTMDEKVKAYVESKKNLPKMSDKVER